MPKGAFTENNPDQPRLPLGNAAALRTADMDIMDCIFAFLCRYRRNAPYPLDVKVQAFWGW